MNTRWSQVPGAGVETTPYHFTDGTLSLEKQVSQREFGHNEEKCKQAKKTRRTPYQIGTIWSHIHLTCSSAISAKRSKSMLDDIQSIAIHVNMVSNSAFTAYQKILCICGEVGVKAPEVNGFISSNGAVARKSYEIF